jgi:hypothetical protein
METNKSIAIIGENNLPELIKDKSGNVIAIVPDRLAGPRKLQEVSNIIKTTADVAEQIFPKPLFK